MEQISADWIKTFSGAVTLCDRDGIILYMNEKAAKTFEKYGGEQLLGTNLLDCHPEPSRTKLRDMLKHETVNVYTIQKDGIKKLIHQSPWYKNGIYIGFAEVSIEIPSDIPNFIRS